MKDIKNTKKEDIPNLTILGQDNSSLFINNNFNDSEDKKLPENLQNHKAFSKIFQKGKMTLGLIAPFKGYPGTPIPNIEDLGEIAELSDRLGFSALWLRDVPFYDPSFGDVGQGLDPMVSLGYLAAKTKNIALGTAGIVSPLREPIHIAKSAVSADILSGGRFILGLSSGDRPIEYPAFKSDFSNRAERFRESWDMIRTLNTQDFPKFEGKYYGNLNGEIDFIPKTRKHIPMVAIGRARQELSWLANKADAWIWHGVNPKDTKNIINTLEKLNQDNTWHPFGYANFVELSEDTKEPVKLYNNIYLQGGSKAILEFWQEQKE